MGEDPQIPQVVAVDPEERLDLLLGHLGTRREGLSEREAARLLEQHGPNGIQRRQGKTRLAEFAAAIIYLPPLQEVFGTNALGVPELALLAVFPLVVWGTDELWRWVLCRRGASEAD